MANISVSDKTHDEISIKAHDAHMTAKEYTERMYSFVCTHEDGFKAEMF